MGSHHLLFLINLIILPSGARLSPGEIVALAGDFYGKPDAPVALLEPSNNVDKGVLKRFKDAYDTLAVAPYEGKRKVCELTCVLLLPKSKNVSFL